MPAARRSAAPAHARDAARPRRPGAARARPGHARRAGRRRLAVPADRRLRASSRTATPARWSRPTARSSGCACRASTARASSARCSTAAPARSALAPYGVDVPAGRRYDPGTNVLETTWMTPTGWLVVRDALTIGDWHGEQRRRPAPAPADRPRRRPPAGAHGRVRAGRGAGRADLRAALRLRARAGALDAVAREDARLRCSTRPTATTTLRLFSDLRMGVEGDTAHARHTMREGEQRFCALSWTRRARRPAHLSRRPTSTSQRTCHFWREWLAAGTYPDHPWREYLQRSALVLKGLTYAPTGAMIAALTTSLPETPGGERNWDYRYCWMRDATFTLWGLHALDLDWEANDFMEYLADLERNKDGSLQIMYGIGGERNLRESDAAPPQGLRRLAAGAQGQRRLQPAPERRLRRGARLRLPAHQAPRPHPRPALAGALRPGRRRLARLAQARPGDLGGARRAAALRLLEADVLGRARSRRAPGRDARRARARACAGRTAPTRSAPTSSSHGVDERGVFVQHYGTTALDASNLLIPIVRFLPGRRRARARDGAGDRRRAQRPRADPALPRRGDRRRAARRGGHVPDLLVLDGLGALGDRRARARARALRAAARARLAARRSTPRSSTRAAAATSATSRRPSRTSR